MNYSEKIFERQKSRKNKRKLIGTEIRYRRNSLSKTLDAISSDVCSISYLCKIEQNLITPNPKYLKTICERVHLDDNQIDYLANLSNNLADLIEAIFNCDNEKVQFIRKNSEMFVNYDSILMCFISSVYFQKWEECHKHIQVLDKLFNQMSDDDVAIYIGVHGIYDYYQSKHLKAFDNLKLALTLPELSEHLRVIIKKYLFYLSYLFNLHNCRQYYKNAYEAYVQYGKYAESEKLRFIYCKYCLINGGYEEARQVSLGITTANLKNNFLVLYYIAGRKNPEALDVKKLDLPYYLIFLRYYDFDRFKEIVSSDIDLSKVNPHMECFIGYLLSTAESGVKECEYLQQYCIPNALQSCNILMLRKYFIWWAKQYIKTNHYKRICDLLFEINEVLEKCPKM